MPKTKSIRVKKIILEACNPAGPSVEEVTAGLHAIRSRNDGHSKEIDQELLQKCRKSVKAVHELEGMLKESTEIVNRLTGEKRQVATFLKTAGDTQVEVLQQNHRFTVPVDPRLDCSLLTAGRTVYLSGDSSSVVEIGGDSDLPGGILGEFDRWEDESRRRMFIKHRDEEIMTESFIADHVTMEPGDVVRFNRESALTFERIGPAPNPTIVTEPPRVSIDQLGGLRDEYEKLRMALFSALIDPDKSRQYGLPANNNVLLTGRPGNGKTLMARIASAEQENEFQTPTRFMHCKPAEWESMWHGQSTKNCREWFASVRREAESAHVIAFFDELDAIGRHRGNQHSGVEDKLTSALLAELDGFDGLPNVCIICATNNKKSLDPAIADRISGCEIVIPRPSRSSAAEIFGIHLPSELPYSPNGSESPQTRTQLIERAVAMLYGPGAEIASVKYADGKTSDVLARDLVSGRIIKQICESASRQAFARDVHHDDPGLRIEDIESGVYDALARMRSSLTRSSIRSYMDGLREDVEIVSVDAVKPIVNNPQQYRSPQFGTSK